MSEIIVKQRGGRWLVYLQDGDRRSLLGGFATRDLADAYADTIASASETIVDAAAVRALTTALHEAEIAGANVRKWTEERNRAIVAALEAGATLRAVATVTGLSHAAVDKISKR